MKVNEIAANQPIPERYLDQILILLRRHGVVQSQRGRRGGYLLAKEPSRITLLEIVTALEGNNHLSPGADLNTFTLEKIAVLQLWQEAAQACHSVLDGYTLQDLCQQREACQQSDPMYYI